MKNIVKNLEMEMIGLLHISPIASRLLVSGGAGLLALVAVSAVSAAIRRLTPAVPGAKGHVQMIAIPSNLQGASRAN